MKKQITDRFPKTQEKYSHIVEHLFRRPEKGALVIAHRGGKSLAKVENTTEAFQTAIDLKIMMVEFDVRKTSDGKIIVFHNNHYKHEKLNTLTYSSICEKTKEAGYCVPLLSDVLKECQDNIMLDIELKEAGYESEVLDLVMQYYDTNQFIITSFLDSVVKRVKQLNPHIKVGLLLGYEHASLWRRFSEFFPVKRLQTSGADFVAPHFRLVTPMLVKSCRLHHYDVVVWTVNNDKIFRKLLKKHVAGIITDYPHRYA